MTLAFFNANALTKLKKMTRIEKNKNMSEKSKKKKFVVNGHRVVPLTQPNTKFQNDCERFGFTCKTNAIVSVFSCA